MRTFFRARRLLLLVTALLLLPTFASADWGCFICVTDYDDCDGLLGPCSSKCEQVGHNEQGDAVQCGPVEIWPGPGGTACAMSGGSCTHTEVNDNDDPPGPGNWCPDGEVC